MIPAVTVTIAFKDPNRSNLVIKDDDEEYTVSEDGSLIELQFENRYLALNKEEVLYIHGEKA